ncbi:MAG: hypothetical protein QOG67_99 [Verrucomicrobiota bacterium]|jgi:hypothetical protein
MAQRQTRIFVPNAAPFDDHKVWVDTLVGTIVRPTLDAFPAVEWFWFSRYGAPHNDSGDCDINAIPANFAIQGIYRSLRFRYSVPDAERPALEDHCHQLIDASGCRVSDFRPYDALGDFASERFLGGANTPERRDERVARMAAFLCATCRLFMHAIEGPDAVGHFHLEQNSEQTNNPYGNTFESVHHLFCNITDPPLHVCVIEPVLGTRIYQKQGIPLRDVKVRF